MKVASKVAWPSGLRRWFKAPVFSEAWVRIPPLSELFSLILHSSMISNKISIHNIHMLFSIFFSILFVNQEFIFNFYSDFCDQMTLSVALPITNFVSWVQIPVRLFKFLSIFIIPPYVHRTAV